jgi:hypothetical protein
MKKAPALSLYHFITSSLHFTFNIPALRRDDSLFTNGWIGDKPCHMTTDTGVSVKITRPDIAIGLPKRKPSKPA